MMTASQILDLIESNVEFEVFGIRADRAGLKVGDALDNSHQWWQDYQWDGDPEEDTEHPYNEEMGCWDDGELDGTCAVEIGRWPKEADIKRALKTVEAYRYNDDVTIYLIGGRYYDVGNDPYEIIIRDAEVAAVIG